MARFIAFYLPQYHPFSENEEWWGKGFTEWTNVAKARPLFRNHHQPNIPADLGFYDLRISSIREEQAELARKAGIEGFCYWHYWFGNGKRLMERPFNEVLESGNPNFPFCLAWANHSWYKKNWNPDSTKEDILLMEQTYPGIEDYREHFHCMLNAFKDPRYIKVDNKLFFIIYDVLNFKDVSLFIQEWRKLAKENNLNDFYFVGRDADSRNLQTILKLGLDATYNDDVFNIHHHLSMFNKVKLALKRKYLKMPTVFKYKKAIEYMVNEDCQKETTIPVIAPNWDHSPRSKHNSIILEESTPILFKKLIETTLSVIKNKPNEKKIIIIKSWNEWGEGNYLEPDLKWGKAYLDVLENVKKEL